MSYNLRAVDGRQNPLLADGLESFFLWVSLKAAQANNALAVSEGYFATHVSKSRPPAYQSAPWGCAGYQIDGGAGVGRFRVDHALPRERRGADLVNEYWRMQLCQFDPLQSRTAWFDGSNWTAPFVHPLFTAQEGAPDLKRYLFRELTVPGTNVTDRWAHAGGYRQTNGVTDSIALVMPFSGPTLLGGLLAAAQNVGHMPALTLKTYYGALDRTRPTHSWTHFTGDSTRNPGAVSGHLMVLQGAFRSILFDDLPGWDISTAGGWSPERVADRLAAVAARYPKFRRNLETVGEIEQSSVIAPPADNRPVEVLYLSGLKSPHPLFPA